MVTSSYIINSWFPSVCSNASYNTVIIRNSGYKCYTFRLCNDIRDRLPRNRLSLWQQRLGIVYIEKKWGMTWRTTKTISSHSLQPIFSQGFFKNTFLSMISLLALNWWEIFEQVRSGWVSQYCCRPRLITEKFNYNQNDDSKEEKSIIQHRGVWRKLNMQASIWT